MIPEGTLSLVTKFRLGGPTPGRRQFLYADLYGFWTRPTGYAFRCSWGALGQIVEQYEYVDPKRRKK